MRACDLYGAQKMCTRKKGGSFKPVSFRSRYKRTSFPSDSPYLPTIKLLWRGVRTVGGSMPPSSCHEPVGGVAFFEFEEVGCAWI